jgi:hypothetical protein
VPGGLPSTQGGSNSLLLMAFCWIAVALVLYILRPGSLRNRGNSKPRDTGFVRKFHALVVTEFFTCGTCVWMLKSWWAYSHALSEMVMYSITIQWTEAVQEFLRTNEEAGSDMVIKYYIVASVWALNHCPYEVLYRSYVFYFVCCHSSITLLSTTSTTGLSSNTSVSKMCCLSEVDSECCWYCHSLSKLFKLSKVWSPPPHPHTHTHTHTKEIFLFSKSIEMSYGCALSCVHWGSGVKWPGHEAAHLFPSNAEVKMERNMLPLLHIPRWP